MMVSARKVKARLDSTKLEELKKKNLEKQEEMGISAQEAQQFSDDLVKSAISGFEKELQKSSPAIKKLAASLSGMIQEFFIGFKEGVDAELSTFVKDIGRTVTKATNDAAISDVLKEQKTEMAISDVLKEQKTEMAISDVLKEQPSIFVPDAPKQPSAPVGPGATAQQKTEMAISDVLKRPTDAGGAAKTVLGKRGGVKDWLTRVGLGSIGMEGIAENIVAKRQRKDAFVQAESKLRAKEFEGKSPGEIRKILEKDFKTVEKTTKELHKTEKQISAYKELGYSDEQAQTLAGEKKQELTEKLIAADPSRLGMYKDKPQEKLEKKESASVREETALEQTKLDQDAAKQRDSQTTLLSEIRDILKTQPKTKANGAASQGNDGIGLPDVLPLPSRGGILKSAGRAALNVVKRVAPLAIAGSIMLGGINAVDTGLGKLGVGKDAEGNDLAIDEKQDDANWDKMSTGGKIMSGAARGIEKVGSFLGLDSLTRGARADRIKSETEYLKNKETTIQNVKKETTELQQYMISPEEQNVIPVPGDAKEYMINSRPEPAKVESKGFFSGIADKAKSFLGFGTPSVDAASIRLQSASIAGQNGVPKPIPQSVSQSAPDSAMQQTAAEIGKNIVIQAPAPVVIPQGGGQQVVSQPFTSNIRNNEPSISDYLRSRYAY